MDGRVRSQSRQFSGFGIGLLAASSLLSACGGAEEESSSTSGGASPGGATALGGANARGGATASDGAASAKGGSVTTVTSIATGGWISSSSTNGTYKGGTGNVATSATSKGGTSSTASGGSSSNGGSKVTSTQGGQSAGGSGVTAGTSFGKGGQSASGGAMVAGAANRAGAPAAGGQPVSGQAGMSAKGGNGASGTSNSNCGAQSQTKSSRSARSAGFTGTYDDNYKVLYSTACVADSDCKAACVTAGGTTTSCASSECIDSTPDYCLPPTFWFDLDRLRIESNTIEDSADITMVNNPYRDPLIANDFQFEIPATATVTGIVFSINRSADSPGMVADYEVKAMRGTATVGLDRAGTTPWSTSFQYANYGSPTDLWGTTWTPADLNASSFGVALTPMYLDSAGNARAYVDFVRATVSYTVPCL